MFPNPFARRDQDTPELRNALADLDRLALERPELARPAGTLRRILVAAFSPGKDHGSASPLDAESIRRKAKAIADALVRDNPAAGSLAKSLRSSDKHWQSWATALLAQRAEDVRAEATSRGLAPELCVSVLRITLLALLSEAPDFEVAPGPTAGPLASGSCPRCSSPPLLAEARGIEQSRRLRCGLCAADWPGERLTCSGCGTSKPAHLRSLSVAGEQDRCRLVLCDQCGFRLKVVATIAPLSPPGLLVAELRAIHLDWLPEEPTVGGPIEAR